ncbi:hypothetical protein [Evansella cellulosilytica]|uniref:Uncharacterized protein n=1 Tax=Evansella cellulosilytica (strain ATCC 21833 / DSM 2522 / FERM P-1141 / JCM 9156 / N-4) TaxID=649639 RepID=E6TST7_EVAC2|nr:hypothetical protein [Evansella cellulosilytica]ADU30729.1 hypothetical protein Bcell_2472 [Evansella cellulosilytica DSM 2522]
MSGLKSIELQVAVPRSQTAGQIQEQLQQRGIITQEQLQQKQLKEQERMKKRVAESETVVNKKVKEESNKKQKQQQDNQHRDKWSEKELRGDEHKRDSHPYKGKHVDLKW